MAPSDGIPAVPRNRKLSEFRLEPLQGRYKCLESIPWSSNKSKLSKNFIRSSACAVPRHGHVCSTAVCVTPGRVCSTALFFAPGRVSSTVQQTELRN
jgi:hypothetical protein